MQMPGAAHLRASSSFFAAGGVPSKTYTGLTPASSMRAVRKNMPCKWLHGIGQVGVGFPSGGARQTSCRIRQLRLPHACPPSDIARLAGQCLISCSTDNHLHGHNSTFGESVFSSALRCGSNHTTRRNYQELVNVHAGVDRDLAAEVVLELLRFRAVRRMVCQQLCQTLPDQTHSSIGHEHVHRTKSVNEQEALISRISSYLDSHRCPPSSYALCIRCAPA